MGLLDRSGRPAGRPGPRRLLVVEDDPALRELYAATLASEGLVDAAADGAEALEQLKTGGYDVILCDVNMPRLDGLGLFERAVALWPELAGSFVFMTGELLEEGGRFFAFFNDDSRQRQLLLKPIAGEDLVGVVRRRLAETAGRVEGPAARPPSLRGAGPLSGARAGSPPAVKRR